MSKKLICLTKFFQKTFEKMVLSFTNKKILVFFTAIFVLFLASFSNSLASPREISSVDYFESLRSNETNVRSGPGQNYPIKFTFKLRGIPVRVINEYDNWSEIEDFEGQSGWVMQSLLTKKRTLLVQTTKSFINMYGKNNEKSRIIFRLENNVIGDYLKCVEDWCGIKINGKKGWVLKDDVFGSDNE
jgi:SH3-like domain-containing protein